MKRKPPWLKIKCHVNKDSHDVNAILEKLNINTVCEEALCPNRGECFSRRTATFMILGRNCTRHCTFCNVSKNQPDIVDLEEPKRVAEATKELGLRYVVITSVTRDDLKDGGAFQFKACIEEIRKIDKEIKVEVLIPDFKGDKDALLEVIKAKPFVINHNIETIKRLYPTVRKEANYDRSLELLRRVKEYEPSMYTKSGIMVGFSETDEEVLNTMKDLREAGCDFLTIGQYLAPSKNHHEVEKYVHPDTFKVYEEKGYEMGYTHIASGPFVRSSYHADEAAEHI